MTREEAIQCIKHELLITVNRKDLTGQAIGEALDMAIKALSQPIVCKDYCIDDDHIYCSPKVADRVVEALQDRPTGTWRIKYGEHCGVLIKECYCDQCGKRGGLATMLYDDKPLPNFCGNCGADMRGSRE